MEINGRELEKAYCCCGGVFEESYTTDSEEKQFGCGRRGCCVIAIECDKCKTRITFDLCSPDFDDND